MLGSMETPDAASAWIRPIPNAISGLRLALAGVFPLAGTSWRVPVVVVGSLSDWLDGWVARRFHVESPAGGIVDAVADKAFALSVLITLAAEGEIRVGQILVVLARDFVVGFVALYYALKQNWVAFTGMPSRLPGKLATVLLFLWFAALVTAFAAPARQGLYLATAAVSLLAAVDYFVRFVQVLSRPPA